MDFALWRRRAFLFAAYASTWFSYQVFLSLRTRIFTAEICLRLAFAVFMGVAFTKQAEKPHPRAVLHRAENIETHGQSALRGDRFHTSSVAAPFNDFLHDPAHDFTPLNLRSTMLGCFGLSAFLLFHRFFFDFNWLLIFYIPIVFFIAHFFIIKRKITANGDGITVCALLRKSMFIAWHEIENIEVWKRTDGEDISQVLVLRGANGAARLCIQTVMLQKTATQKVFKYLRTAVPAARIPI